MLLLRKWSYHLQEDSRHLCLQRVKPLLFPGSVAHETALRCGLVALWRLGTAVVFQHQEGTRPYCLHTEWPTFLVDR